MKGLKKQVTLLFCPEVADLRSASEATVESVRQLFQRNPPHLTCKVSG